MGQDRRGRASDPMDWEHGDLPAILDEYHPLRLVGRDHRLTDPESLEARPFDHSVFVLPSTWRGSYGQWRHPEPQQKPRLR